MANQKKIDHSVPWWGWVGWLSVITLSFAFSPGRLEALFAGMAFVGLLVTLHLQIAEMRQTTIELQKTAKAQDESQRALYKQIEVMRDAALLNAYSAMLSYYNSPSQQNTNREATKERTDAEAKIKQLANNMHKERDDEYKNRQAAAS